MNKPFSGWQEGLQYYMPPLVTGVIVTPLILETAAWFVGPLMIAGGLCMLAFFRDPPRRIPGEPGAMVSPADGTVVAIEDLAETDHYDGPCRRISIFLSVFNVHVNRAASAGRVTKVLYKRGVYKNAMSAESSKVNESNAIWFETPEGPVTIRQISGAVARRIVCAVEPGTEVARGAKIGMIKFGSRTELYMPPDTEICVRIKEKVKGGATVVARAPALAGEVKVNDEVHSTQAAH